MTEIGRFLPRDAVVGYPQTVIVEIQPAIRARDQRRIVDDRLPPGLEPATVAPAIGDESNQHQRPLRLELQLVFLARPLAALPAPTSAIEDLQIIGGALPSGAVRPEFDFGIQMQDLQLDVEPRFGDVNCRRTVLVVWIGHWVVAAD